MHIIDRLLGRPSASDEPKKRDLSEDYWYRPLSRPVTAGVAVTAQKALTQPVVYDCCQVLSQTVGTLPWGIFERKPDGSKARRDQHPLAFAFADSNPETTTGELFGQIVFDLATEGDAFLEIEAVFIGAYPEHIGLEGRRVGLSEAQAIRLEVAINELAINAAR
jgi:phage portal protein BeeE